MKQFMDKQFLLESETAQNLYHNYAAPTPILDYHCHLNPREIYENQPFPNITEAWLGGDHYKWRQMRSNGVDESAVTGNAPAREKFQKWAETLEKLIGNPLYHWSHLELQRFFGYNGHLCGETAQEVWELCNEKLAQPDMRPRSLIQKSNVTLICTTDDPADALMWHEKLQADPDFDVRVLPAWRPDAALNIEKPAFLEYLQRLSKAAHIDIKTPDDLKAALLKRMEFFRAHGCRVSDHGLDDVCCAPASEARVKEIFAKRLAGGELTAPEIAQYKTALLLFLGKEYHRFNWVMQLHFGCMRNANSRMFSRLGPDSGFDCIGNSAPAAQLTDFLNALDVTDELPKTILYSLNPADDAVIGAMIGCFQNSEAAGKIQQGSAWWFNDHKTGMIRQMTSLANLGVFGNFVGMLTDSRSFLSYPRHEYFRRILCNLIGGWVENGEYPYDEKALKKLIKGICYNNAVNYFGFDLAKDPA